MLGGVLLAVVIGLLVAKINPGGPSPSPTSTGISTPPVPPTTATPAPGPTTSPTPITSAVRELPDDGLVVFGGWVIAEFTGCDSDDYLLMIYSADPSDLSVTFTDSNGTETVLVDQRAPFADLIPLPTIGDTCKLDLKSGFARYTIVSSSEILAFDGSALDSRDGQLIDVTAFEAEAWQIAITQIDLHDRFMMRVIGTDPVIAVPSDLILTGQPIDIPAGTRYLFIEAEDEWTVEKVG